MSTLRLKLPGRFLLPFVCFLVTLVRVPTQESRPHSLDIGQYNDIAYVDPLEFLGILPNNLASPTCQRYPSEGIMGAIIILQGTFHPRGRGSYPESCLCREVQ